MEKKTWTILGIIAVLAVLAIVGLNMFSITGLKSQYYTGDTVNIDLVATRGSMCSLVVDYNGLTVYNGGMSKSTSVVKNLYNAQTVSFKLSSPGSYKLSATYKCSYDATGALPVTNTYVETQSFSVINAPTIQLADDIKSCSGTKTCYRCSGTSLISNSVTCSQYALTGCQINTIQYSASQPACNGVSSTPSTTPTTTVCSTAKCYKCSGSTLLGTSAMCDGSCPSTYSKTKPTCAAPVVTPTQDEPVKSVCTYEVKSFCDGNSYVQQNCNERTITKCAVGYTCELVGDVSGCVQQVEQQVQTPICNPGEILTNGQCGTKPIQIVCDDYKFSDKAVIKQCFDEMNFMQKIVAWLITLFRV